MYALGPPHTVAFLRPAVGYETQWETVRKTRELDRTRNLLGWLRLGWLKIYETNYLNITKMLNSLNITFTYLSISKQLP